MGNKRSFNEMLNEYLAYDLLKHESIKRTFLLSKVEIDESWKGGNLVVPFQGGSASSFKYGGLTSTSDVSENKYVRGNVASQKEIWGTMKFHARDLMEHGGSGVSEQSFLKNLLGTVEDFTSDMKQVVSVNLQNGTHFATLTAASSSAAGVVVVDHPERFTIGKKVKLVDGNSDITGYVREIDMNAMSVTLYDARTGGAALDLSTTEALASGALCYVDGADTNAFTSLKAQLLPASVTGGSATQFGVTKTLYPYLQATAVSGASLTNATLLDGIFDFVNKHRRIGRGNAAELVCGYRILGVIMRELEDRSGAYRHVNTEASLYGWTTITIQGVKGEFKITAVQEQDDDCIFLMDWSAVKLHTQNLWKKHVDPNGNSYYTVREDDGYVYYVDLCMYGELVVNKPAHCGVLHSIPSTVA